MSEKREIEFNAKQLAIAIEKGIIPPDEEVKALTSVWKYSMVIFTNVILARILQRHYLFVVTSQQIYLIRVPAFLVHARSKAYSQHIATKRPCLLELTDPPKKEHRDGNPVLLPSDLAAFVGRKKVFVIYGLIAQKAFDVASQKPEGSD